MGRPAVEVSAQDSNVLIRAIGELKLTLAQQLAALDPALNDGEAIRKSPVGNRIAWWPRAARGARTAVM
jgi:hypothetical protein